MQKSPSPQSTSKPRGRLLAAGAAAVIVLVGLGAFAFAPEKPHNMRTAAATDTVQLAQNSPVKSGPPRMMENGAPFSFADLVEGVGPAVVSVTVEQKQQPTQANPELPDNIPEPFREFFREFGNRGAPQRPAMGVGSGFIIDKSGLIVTNNHVVDESAKITVKLPDGRQFDAKLIGADAATDVALLKVKSDKPLPTVEFGDDRQLRVGDWVVAVGNPFGLSNSVTAGIVSSIGRDVGNGPYTDFIQIDASINRGNSGGPTFDLRGKVIGMNSMIYSPTGGSVGIGFAIPASTIHDVLAQLQSHGKVSRGWLGVQIQSITPEIAASLGQKDMKGAIIAEVMADGPAAKSGFQQGDIVLSVNGKTVQDSRDLSRQVAGLSVGSKAKFNVQRDGQRREIITEIAQRKDQVTTSTSSEGGKPGLTAKPAKALGLGLSPLSADLRRQYNLEPNVEGVVITEVDPSSHAAREGLRAGDVVRSVGNKAVRTPQDVQSRVQDVRQSGRNSVLFLITRGTAGRFVALEIKE